MFYFLFPICPSLGLSLVGVDGVVGVVGVLGCVVEPVPSSSQLLPQLLNNAPANNKNGINFLFILKYFGAKV